MRTQHRISHAWCVQTQRVLSVLAARQAFFEQESPRRRFDFLCANPDCRRLGVPITGVNYDKWPQEGAHFHAAHYRINPHHRHAPGCGWFEQLQELPERLPGESELTALGRLAKHKLSDYVDIFGPDSADAGSTEETAAPQTLAGNATAATHDLLAQGATRGPSIRRSHSLERLVESYREAKASLEPDEFAALRLRVPILGEIALRSYFRSIAYAKPGDNHRVLWGGALLVKRYGIGFRLKFYDRVDGKPVFLYVSKDSMGAYRHRRYIEELLTQADAVKYFTAYALGPLKTNEKQDAFSLEISDLRRLVLILGPAIPGTDGTA